MQAQVDRCAGTQNQPSAGCYAPAPSFGLIGAHSAGRLTHKLLQALGVVLVLQPAGPQWLQFQSSECVGRAGKTTHMASCPRPVLSPTIATPHSVPSPGRVDEDRDGRPVAVVRRIIVLLHDVVQLIGRLAAWAQSGFEARWGGERRWEWRQGGSRGKLGVVPGESQAARRPERSGDTLRPTSVAPQRQQFAGPGSPAHSSAYPMDHTSPGC